MEAGRISLLQVHMLKLVLCHNILFKASIQAELHLCLCYALAAMLWYNIWFSAFAGLWDNTRNHKYQATLLY